MIEKIKNIFLKIFRWSFFIKALLILLFIILVLHFTLYYWIYTINFYGVTVYKINFIFFIPIVLFSGSVSYFVLNYLDRIRISENQSIGNLIFVIIFFILLFIPALKINQKM